MERHHDRELRRKAERARGMTTDERARRESVKTTVLGEIKATKKEKLPQHTGKETDIVAGKREKKNLRWEEKKESKRKKIVRDRQSIAER